MLKKMLCTLALLGLTITSNVLLPSVSHAYTMEDFYGTWYLYKTAVEGEVTDTVALGDHSRLRIYERDCTVIHNKYPREGEETNPPTHPAVQFSEGDGTFEGNYLDIDFRKDEHSPEGYIVLPTYGATQTTLTIQYDRVLQWYMTFPQDAGRGWNMRLYQREDPFAGKPSEKKVPKLVREQ